MLALFVLLRVDISRMRVGKPFSTGRVGTYYFDMTPLPFVKTTKCPISAGVQASAKHGELHSQPAGVNNVPNNYVTVFGLPHEDASPPSPTALQYANGETLRSENWI